MKIFQRRKSDSTHPTFEQVYHRKTPWKNIPSQWEKHEDLLTHSILLISSTPKFFMVDVPEKFEFNFAKASKLSEMYLDFDPKLRRIYNYYVPGIMTDEKFWEKYFYNVRTIRTAKDIQRVEEILLEQYRTSKYAHEQLEIEKELKDDMKDITKKVIHLRECLKKIDKIRKVRLNKNDTFTMSLKIEEDDEDLEEVITISEVQSKFLQCVNLKKKISLLLTELIDPENPVLMEQIKAINFLFQKLIGEYQFFQKERLEDNEEDSTTIHHLTDFSPRLIGAKLTPPSFTTEDQRKYICSQFPIRFQRSNWKLRYSTVEHGISLFTLIERCRNKGETVLLIKTKKGEIFGFFNGVSWKNSRKYYGSGESFVFSFIDDEFQSYKWTQNNHLFCISNYDSLSIGGGTKGGSAIWLDNDLKIGSSQYCETFDSQPLCKEKEFSVVTLEIWGFLQEKKKGIIKYKKTRKLTEEEKIEKIKQISKSNPSLMGASEVDENKK